MKEYCMVAGITFEGRDEKANKIKEGDIVTLIATKYKEDDAIEIHWNDEHVGYVPAKIVSETLPLIDEDFNVVRDSRDEDGKLKGVGIGLLSSNEEEELLDGQLYSFTEPTELFHFDEEAHKYTYLKDPSRKFTSGSKFIKPFIEPFDSITASEGAAQWWNISAETIRQKWSDNNSNDFGTVLHKVLEEHSNNKQEFGIQSKTGRPYFDPKLPFLKEFIDEFEELVKDLPYQESVQEPLLTDVENGYVGFSDIIGIVDADKKICRVGDYKINHSIDVKDKNIKFKKPYTNLEPTKLNKIRFQMEFYARLLERAGWRVDGLDVFCWDGEWKHYEIDRLDIDM